MDRHALNDYIIFKMGRKEVEAIATTSGHAREQMMSRVLPREQFEITRKGTDILNQHIPYLS
jgi:hypothetical protein